MLFLGILTRSFSFFSSLSFCAFLFCFFSISHCFFYVSDKFNFKRDSSRLTAEQIGQDDDSLSGLEITNKNPTKALLEVNMSPWRPIESISKSFSSYPRATRWSKQIIQLPWERTPMVGKMAKKQRRCRGIEAEEFWVKSFLYMYQFLLPPK